MIGLKLETEFFEDLSHPAVPVAFHPSFLLTYKKLRQWLDRFPLSFDDVIVSDLVLFYSLAKKKYLDHRNYFHLFRLVLSIYNVQRKLLSSLTLFPLVRHFTARWIPTNLLFPFSSKPVLGCLMGFNVMDRCELFDEETIQVVLQKNFPELQLVKDSYYRHTSQYENLRVFYFEVEKRDGKLFSLAERKKVEESFAAKIRNSIQKLVPSVFMKFNQEEVYKNVLILSQEMMSIHDLPQVSITLEKYTGKEIVFHVSLVQIAPLHGFSFKERIVGGSFILERSLPVRSLDGHQVEAHLFRVLLPCDASLLRSDGSLDFYAARSRVVGFLTQAIGEFRDYNGGLLIKQQELLFSFRQLLPEVDTLQDSELVETFFHALLPLDKQALLDPQVLASLFLYFQEHRKEKGHQPFSLKVHEEKQRTFISLRAMDPAVLNVVTPLLRAHLVDFKDFAYNTLELNDGVFLNGVLWNSSSAQARVLVQVLHEALNEWSHKQSNQKNLRIALGHAMVSLDPRVGGETVSSNILRLLFEGLTRFNPSGHIENAVAEKIEISSDLKSYVFHLRPCLWNDGSFISAHDFAYSWKKVLSPDFTTSFAAFFYPIKNAKEAKEGKVSTDEIGVHVLNDQKLRIDLVRPTPYFLQLLAHPVFSPIHRLVDQESPQWPYQSGKLYPCNGPFQLRVNQPNQGYQCVKNPLYWDAATIRLDQITLTPMDPFQAIHAFSKGDIDWVGNPFGSWHSFYGPEKEATVVSSPHNSVCWLVFNTASHPLQHAKLRQALALALDRDQLVQDAYLPITAAYSILLPRHCEKGSRIFPKHDRMQAVQLLEEALSELGISRSDFSLQLICHAKSIQEWVAKFVCQQLSDHLGIECQLLPLSWDACFRRMNEGKFQLYLMHWTSLVDDPIYTFNAFKFAREWVNFSNWEHSDFQQHLDLSEREMNPFQRSLYFYRAEALLAQEFPVVPLFYQPAQAMIRKDCIHHSREATRGIMNFGNKFYTER